jgi:hypothetical protein
MTFVASRFLLTLLCRVQCPSRASQAIPNHRLSRTQIWHQNVPNVGQKHRILGVLFADIGIMYQSILPHRQHEREALSVPFPWAGDAFALFRSAMRPGLVGISVKNIFFFG